MCLERQSAKRRNQDHPRQEPGACEPPNIEWLIPSFSPPFSGGCFAPPFADRGSRSIQASPLAGPYRVVDTPGPLCIIASLVTKATTKKASAQGSGSAGPHAAPRFRLNLGFCEAPLLAVLVAPKTKRRREKCSWLLCIAMSLFVIALHQQPAQCRMCVSFTR